MTEEERKAFQYYKECNEKDLENYEYLGDVSKKQAKYLELLLNLIEKQSKEIEHQKEKRENQKKELAILNAKQIEFNKLVNTVNSYKGQFKRQEKEIEELHKEINQRIKLKLENERDVDEHFIYKDKIKEILGIEENIDKEKLLSLLQTIVDENARLEDIEDRKVQIEYNNVFNKGVKSVEDKIKALIKELEKLNEEATGNGFGFAIHYLKSLLKEE